MSHVSVQAGWRQPMLQALFGVGLAMAFLAAGVWQTVAQLESVSDNWPALIASLGLKLEGTPLGHEALRFIFNLAVVHACFGLACWLVALATVRAWPSLRLRIYWVITSWFAVGVTWLLVGNATEYPWSKTGVHAEWFTNSLLGRVRLLDLLNLMLFGAFAVILVRNAATMPRVRRLMPRIAAYSAVVVVLLSALHWRQVSALGQEAVQAGSRPNIILIGVDSLRPDAVGQIRGLGVTPNIDVFLRDGAHSFSDAITPLARTFGSWTAILSGRYPHSTGARENLMALSGLRKFETVASIARARGYHTIYATDETRFSNIDATFGFDQTITPTMGVADFLLGKGNDFPLTNMLSNTRLARWWFPATYANRASAHTYKPDTFVQWLDDEIENQGPTMMAVHLTLPHVPYHWAEEGDAFGDRHEMGYKYMAGVIAADQQFGAIMEMLERKHMLSNAVVVLLSDHGEALGIPLTDTMLHGAKALELLEGDKVALWGHGLSVLSQYQYSVVLAVRGFGPSELPPGRVHAEPVSLVDIAPTLMDLAGLTTDFKFDGRSMRPLIIGTPDAEQAFAKRSRFTETGFRTPLLAEGHFDERSVVGQGAAFFQMNQADGRLEVRPELVGRLIADKERAALSSNWVLAAIPSGNRQKYVFVNRRGEAAQRIESAPPDDDSELSRLWRDFHAHYGEELLPPAPRQAAMASVETR